MKVTVTAALTGAAVALVCACGGAKRDVAALKDALSQTEVSLADSIARAEAHESRGYVGKRARLAASASSVFFSVVATAEQTDSDIVVDAKGNVLSTTAVGPGTTSCTGSTTLGEAVRIGESASGGRAVEVQPDDDDACLYEVLTIAGSILWEVKIDRNGRVLEKEDATNDTED